LQVTLSVGTWYGQAAPGMAVFDNFVLDRGGTETIPPVANAGGPYFVTATTNTQFYGNDSYDTDGSITGYSWDFGDGQSGTGASPTHAYQSGGVYPVTLSVTDNYGAVGRATTTVTVSNHPPAANAGGPYTGAVNANIQFNGTASTDPDGTVAAYHWDFADGGGYLSTAEGSAPTHTYTHGGYYTATLTVIDNKGGECDDDFRGPRRPDAPVRRRGRSTCRA
jgi:PKD repeat protein